MEQFKLISNPEFGNVRICMLDTEVLICIDDVCHILKCERGTIDEWRSKPSHMVRIITDDSQTPSQDVIYASGYILRSHAPFHKSYGHNKILKWIKKSIGFKNIHNIEGFSLSIPPRTGKEVNVSVIRVHEFNGIPMFRLADLRYYLNDRRHTPASYVAELKRGEYTVKVLEITAPYDKCEKMHYTDTYGALVVICKIAQGVTSARRNAAINHVIIHSAQFAANQLKNNTN